MELEADVGWHTVCINAPAVSCSSLKEGTMADEGTGTASSAIWAVALIVIVVIIFGALYYGGILSGKQKKEIDINVTAPAR